MTNHNHKIELPCKFAEQVVEVLYDEATEEARREFEKHLIKCNSCTAELAAFGTVRNAVAEWRQTDFSLLKTPPIVLSTTDLAPVAEKTSWLIRFGELLFPNTGHLQGATAIAGFMICIGLLAVFGYVLVNRYSKIEVVSVPKNEPDYSALNSPTPPPNPMAVLPLTEPTIEMKPNVTEEVSVKPVSKIVKSNDSQTKTASPAPVRRTKNRSAPVAVAPKPNDLTVESVDEFEDDSLRLSDLLDELTPSM